MEPFEQICGVDASSNGFIHHIETELVLCQEKVQPKRTDFSIN